MMNGNGKKLLNADSMSEVKMRSEDKNALATKKGQEAKKLWRSRKTIAGILVTAIVVCIISVVWFVQNAANVDEKDSLLKVHNLADLTLQQNDQTLTVRTTLDDRGEFEVSTEAVAEFLRDVDWTQKYVSSPYELAADITFIWNQDTSLRFYESEQELAMVLSGGKWRYYKMDEGDYEQVLELLETSSESSVSGVDEDIVDEGVVVCYEAVANSPQIVSYTYSNANMELQLPAGWEYEIEEYNEDSSAFGIHFWPAGVEDGEISLLYYGNMFGVCGTGLSTEDVTFENGLQASIGTYDNSPVWSYMVYVGTPGSYVASVRMDKEQWKEYEDEVMDILGNAKLGQGIMWESEAIAIAMEKCTVECDSARGTYDFETGEWTVRFYNKQKAVTGQLVWVNAQGEAVIEEIG